MTKEKNRFFILIYKNINHILFMFFYQLWKKQYYYAYYTTT